jgi:hypothetical protein
VEKKIPPSATIQMSAMARHFVMSDGKLRQKGVQLPAIKIKNH